jgi:hypothetical protein
MGIKSAIRIYLTGQAGITALVGSSPVRIYPIKLPQKNPKLPALTYRRLSGQHGHNIGGSSGTAIPTFRFDCWGATYEDADKLAEAMRQVMQGFGGEMDDTDVRTVVLADDFDDYEPPEDGSDDGFFHVTLDYAIRYTETIPTPGE